MADAHDSSSKQVEIELTSKGAQESGGSEEAASKTVGGEGYLALNVCSPMNVVAFGFYFRPTITKLTHHSLSHAYL
jgi:hypothetical protein